MESNQGSDSLDSMPSSSTMAKKSPVEANERKSSSNSNGDSGYHSDLSGYHKGDDSVTDYEKAALKNAASTDELHSSDHSGDYISTIKIVSRKNSCTAASHGAAHDLGHQSEVVSASESIAAKHSNSYVTSNNGAIKSCSTCTHSNYDFFETNHVTTTAVNSTNLDCNFQEMAHIYTTVTSYLPMKATSSYHSNEDQLLKTAVHDLALKIEFCLMFGYTIAQIKTAITKLTYRASKNDILAELSTIQSLSVIPATKLSMMTSHEDSHYSPLGERSGELIAMSVDVDTLGERAGELISKGADNNLTHDSDLRSHGPLSVDNDNKENNGGRCVVDESENLRPVIIDGSNVAMSHGNKQYFSCKGILLAVDYFRNRSHRDITVFVPNYRKELPRSDAPIKDRHILDKLEDERILVYTPSRHINGKRVTCYDDRFILRLAEETDGIIVSNDHFRDLQNEKPEWKELVEKRLLMFSFVSDRFMPPDDPLGRNGPSINNFLRKRPANEEQSKRQCPYGKKCTYGKKCKFFHPEFARPVSERMKEESEKRIRASTESVELALQLIKAGDDHSPSLTIRDKSNCQAPSLHCGSSQSQERRSLSNGWKGDNARSRRVANTNMHEDNNTFPQNQGCGRIVSGPTPGDNSYPHNSQYPINGANLPDAFRRLSLTNHYGLKPNSQMSNSHSNGQVCYDSHYPLINDPSRIGFPSNSYVRAENGPIDYRIDSQAKYKSAVINQQYQHAPPANMGMIDRNNSANSVLQRQRLNANPSYPSVQGYHSSYPSAPSHPIYPAGYNESAYPTNQHVYYNVSHSQDNGGIHPGMLSSSSYYVGPINSSTGSNGSSLSHSYPFVPLEKTVPTPALSHHNLTNSSTGSEPKTYPPRAPRGYSSPNPQQHLHQSHYNSNSSFVQDVQSLGPAAHMPSSELPLSNVNNPRHYLYRNLCSLFQQHVVEAVMSAHPEVREPNVLVKMCLGSN